MYCLAVSELEGLSCMVSEVLCMELLNLMFHVASMLEKKAHVPLSFSISTYSFCLLGKRSKWHILLKHVFCHMFKVYFNFDILAQGCDLVRAVS